MSTETENLQAGIPVFKDKKVKEGWILNIFQNNSLILTTSLYNDSGTFLETKSFNTQSDNDIAIFKKYIEYFEEDPVKNVSKMLKMKVRIK